MTFSSIIVKLKKHPQILGLVLALGLSILIYIYKDQLLKLGSYGYAGLFIINLLGGATIFLPTPLFLTSIVASSFLNPILVIIFSSLGSALGEFTGYLAGRGAEELLEKDIKIKKVKGWMDKYGFWALLALAAIPNPLFDIAGMIAGATQIPFKKFIFIVWLGKLIKYSLIVLLGINSMYIIDRVL